MSRASGEPAGLPQLSRIRSAETNPLLRYKRLDGVSAALHTLLATLLRSDDRQAIDATLALAAVTAPVAVVWGGADRILPRPPEVHGGTPVICDAAGHMVHMEAAADIVRIIRSQLERRGS